MKIAIVTLYGEYNIGNKLQNYALEVELVKMGHIPTTIVTEMYQPVYVKMKYIGLAFLAKIPKIKDPRVVENSMVLKRKHKISDFSKRYLHLSSKIDYRNFKKLNVLSKKYDFFIAGSDQVWGEFVDVDDKAFDLFFLKFTEKNKRIAVSPSFGRDVFLEKMYPRYKEAFEGFKCISCREEEGKVFINKFLKEKVPVLIDPTMVLPVEEWRKIEKKPIYSLPKEYILDYRLGSDKKKTDHYIDDISKKTNLDIVNIYNVKYRNQIFEETGPEEFLYLIDHANLVITDSYHGCVFSILFRKNFVCASRNETQKKTDMNSRLNTLLKKFKLENREQNQIDSNLLFNTDYGETESIIKVEQQRYWSYLYKAFSV